MARAVISTLPIDLAQAASTASLPSGEGMWALVYRCSGGALILERSATVMSKLRRGGIDRLGGSDRGLPRHGSSDLRSRAMIAQARGDDSEYRELADGISRSGDFVRLPRPYRCGRGDDLTPSRGGLRHFVVLAVGPSACESRGRPRGPDQGTRARLSTKHRASELGGGQPTATPPTCRRPRRPTPRPTTALRPTAARRRTATQPYANSPTARSPMATRPMASSRRRHGRASGGIPWAVFGLIAVLFIGGARRGRHLLHDAGAVAGRACRVAADPSTFRRSRRCPSHARFPSIPRCPAPAAPTPTRT